MEIHQSSLIYSPRNKGPQPVGKTPRADEKNSQKAKHGVEVTLSTKTDASKADLTQTYSDQQGTTKSSSPPLQFDTVTSQSIDIRTQKALIAYSAEQNQIPQDNTAQLVSGVDYIV